MTATPEQIRRRMVQEINAKRELEMTRSGIIDCYGTYEVHPEHQGKRWLVVNGETGSVRGHPMNLEDATDLAETLNGDS